MMAVIFMLPRALILFCSIVVFYMLPEEKKKMSAESFDFAILDGCHFMLPRDIALYINVDTLR